MKYLKLFFTFFKIGLLSFGGGYGMIIVMKDELTKKKLISEEEFMEALVIAQSAPGPLAVNISIVSAKKIAGSIGVLIATIGVVLPSFLIILLLSTVFNKIKDNAYVIKFMKGTKPAVLALITMSFYELFIKYKKTVPAIVLIILTLLLTVVFKIHPALILIIIGFVGYFIRNLD